jgi:hypothetical protein
VRLQFEQKNHHNTYDPCAHLLKLAQLPSQEEGQLVGILVTVHFFVNHIRVAVQKPQPLQNLTREQKAKDRG